MDAAADYRLLFEHAAQGVFVTDAQGRYLDANEFGLELLGYSLEELRELTLREVLAPEEHGRPLRLAELEAGHVVVSERMLRRGDGTVIRAEISARSLPDGRIIGLVRDVTAHFRTEQALRESEERYRTLVDSSPLGILIFQEGHIAFANPAMAQMLGHPPHELMEMSPARIAELVHRDDRERVFERIRARLAGEPSIPRYEFRTVASTGQIRWLEINSNLIEYGGRPAVQTVVADVTDRKRAEQELADRERWFRALIESAGDTIFVLNRDGSLRYVSPAVEQLLGCRPEEVRESPFVAPGADDELAAAVCSAVEAIFSDASRTEAVSGLLRRRDGEQRQVDCTLRALVEDGEVTGVRVTVRDVTEHAALEQQLLQAQKMEAVGRLAGGIAHDFNNMLAVIMAETSLLTYGGDTDSPHLQTILSASERAAALVKQLLTFSRKQPVRATVFRLSGVLENVGSMLQRVLGEKVRLEIELRDGASPVFADRAQIEQVLVNLAVNARDAMPDGGLVRIETDRCALGEAEARRVGLEAGQYVTIAIIDEGVGMTEAVQQRVFEPFFTTKEPGYGTGLGLATCYGVITRFGGTLRVHSKPGRGTRVEVWLPLGDESQSAEGDSSVAAEATPGEEHILLVENDPNLRKTVAKLLVSLGYRVTEAENGRDALGKIEHAADPIDVVFSDVVMPHLGGEELVERLRQTHPHLPVVLTSGYFEGGSLHARLESYGLPFVSKPYSLETVASAIRRALDKG